MGWVLMRLKLNILNQLPDVFFLIHFVGIPIRASMTRVEGQRAIIGEFKSRLSKCKVKMLFVRGQVTLLKSTLGSLDIYYMPIFKLPKMVCHFMESLRGLFFWGGQSYKCKINQVKQTLSRPRQIYADVVTVGGRLFVLNHDLLQNQMWCSMNGFNSLWVKVSKYS